MLDCFFKLQKISAHVLLTHSSRARIKLGSRKACVPDATHVPPIPCYTVKFNTWTLNFFSGVTWII